jgi:hypothetical protein
MSKELAAADTAETMATLNAISSKGSSMMSSKTSLVTIFIGVNKKKGMGSEKNFRFSLAPHEMRVGV